MNNPSRILAALLLALLALPAAAQVRREIRIPDLPGWRTLKCDLHMHTVFSDGEVWPTTRVKEAAREGLDAICISDHIEYQPRQDDIPTKHNRPFEAARDLARELDVILVRGCEITRGTPPGHYNALFLSDCQAFEPLKQDFAAMMAEAGRQKAFVFWNHHAWQGEDKGVWSEVQTRLVEQGQLHGMEVVNGGAYYPNALAWCAEKKLVMLGNSDIHEPSVIQDNNGEPHRPMTLVFARERTHDGLREALFAGRTVVWGGDFLYGPEEWLAALAGAIIVPGRPFPIRGTTWGVYLQNRSCIPLELTRTGGPGPAKLSLPRDAAVLVKFDAPGQPAAPAFSWRVENFWTADRQPVSVRIGAGG
jgi:3',5'-nucleoside bisphosphate phosphatase